MPQERILVLAPTRRDAEVTVELLHGLRCVAVGDVAGLVAEMASGAGVVVLTDSALGDPNFGLLQAALSSQEPWSDIPVLLLMRENERTPRSVHALETLTNVMLLDRPSSMRTVVSAVHSALRSRRKQFQIRDHLAQRAHDEAALRAADQRKDEFLATLAHELRNPLAAVFTAIQLLERHADDGARAKRTIAMMDRQTRLLVKLIDDLMDVSRISSGKMVLEKSRLDLRAVIETALESGELLLQAAGHALQLELPSTPVWVDGDKARLAQVVGNLVRNAAKYTPEGGRIRVTLAQEGDHATVQVADNGVGIPADMLGSVFDLFTQVNRTLDRAQGGLGIGLSLVRRLIELHGGSVSARSPGVDQGSVFTLSLPLASAPPPDAAAGATDDPGSVKAPALRILIVDDNVDAAEALASFLIDEGYEVQVRHSGAEALVAAAQFAPQVVFCDIGMPGMDGHQVASRLRADARYASMLLVALTGWGSEEQKRQTQAAGFDRHLTKPVDLDDIERLLATV